MSGPDHEKAAMQQMIMELQQHKLQLLTALNKAQHEAAQLKEAESQKVVKLGRKKVA